MSETIISLISILCGILGALAGGYVYKKYSLGINGNAIVGAFGSILMIKSIGRFGIDPYTIMESGSVNFGLLVINIVMSVLGGFITIVLISRVKSLAENR